MSDLFLPRYLEEMVRLQQAFPGPAGYAYRSRDTFLKAHGQPFPIAADQSLPPGKYVPYPQQCFDNAYKLARRYPKRFRYVEGLALGVIPVHHAWVINEAGEVLDPTWSRYSTLGTEYFGVVIPLDIVTFFRWQRGFPLFKEPWETVLQRNSVELSPR